MDDDQPTVSINGVSHPILCGTCNAPIAFRGEPNPDGGEIGCADCSNWGDAHEVGQIALEYVKDEAQIRANRALESTARQIGFATFRGDTAHDKAHRFTVDF